MCVCVCVCVQMLAVQCSTDSGVDEMMPFVR